MKILTTIALAIAVTLFCTGGAITVNAKKGDKDTFPGLLLGSEIKGSKVINLQNEKIGEIEEILVEPASGLIRFAIIGVGGFLGLGETRVAVPWGAFVISKEGDKPKYVLDATKEMLKNAPKVEGKNYDKLGTRATGEPVVLYWHEEWIVEPTPTP
jgi:sporulation protein YlmC with PRC-barrel domain